VDWRTRLEEALSDADVLLIVATGRQKLSHSYTGFEVGFFSVEARPREDAAFRGSFSLAWLRLATSSSARFGAASPT
jgi:hypothetical protein